MKRRLMVTANAWRRAQLVCFDAPSGSLRDAACIALTRKRTDVDEFGFMADDVGDIEITFPDEQVANWLADVCAAAGARQLASAIRLAQPIPGHQAGTPTDYDQGDLAECPPTGSTPMSTTADAPGQGDVEPADEQRLDTAIRAFVAAYHAPDDTLLPLISQEERAGGQIVVSVFDGFNKHIATGCSSISPRAALLDLLDNVVRKIAR